MNTSTSTYNNYVEQVSTSKAPLDVLDMLADGLLLPTGTDQGVSDIIQSIRVDLIDIEPIINREIDQEYINDLARNIGAHNSLLQPIQVRHSGVGRFKVVFGEQRVHAIRRLGWESIEARVVSITDEEAALRYISENMLHNPINVMERAALTRYMREVMGWSWQELSERMGYPRSTARDYEALLTLTQEWQRFMNARPRSLRYGRRAANLNESMQGVLMEYIRIVENDREVLNFSNFDVIVQELQGFPTLLEPLHSQVHDALIAFFRVARNSSAANFIRFAARLRRQFDKGRTITPERLQEMITRSLSSISRRPPTTYAAILAGTGWTPLAEAELPELVNCGNISGSLLGYARTLSENQTDDSRDHLVVGRVYNELVRHGFIRPAS